MRPERVKEELSLLRLLIGILLAADLSAIAWVGQNHTRVDVLAFAGACVAVPILTVGLVFLVRWSYQLFDRLEDA